MMTHARYAAVVILEIQMDEASLVFRAGETPYQLLMVSEWLHFILIRFDVQCEQEEPMTDSLLFPTSSLIYF